MNKEQNTNPDAGRMGPDDPRLTAWVLGELPPAEAEVVARAVAADPELAAAADELRALASGLGDAFRAELAAGGADRSGESGAPAPTPRPFWQRAPWLMPLAATLTLVGLIGTALWWQEEPAVYRAPETPHAPPPRVEAAAAPRDDAAEPAPAGVTASAEVAPQFDALARADDPVMQDPPAPKAEPAPKVPEPASLVEAYAMEVRPAPPVEPAAEPQPAPPVDAPTVVARAERVVEAPALAEPAPRPAPVEVAEAPVEAPAGLEHAPLEVAAAPPPRPAPVATGEVVALEAYQVTTAGSLPGRSRRAQSQESALPVTAEYGGVSHIRRSRETESALPVTVLDFSDLESIDAKSAAQLFRYLPEAGFSDRHGRPEPRHHSRERPLRPGSLDVFDRTQMARFRPTEVDRFTTIGMSPDTASWALVRRLLRQGRYVPRDAVRVEELVNAFPYSDAAPGPRDPHPVALTVGAMPSPWNPERVLVRVAVKAREVVPEQVPPLNVVFLIDTSGSMSPPDRLPLVKEGLTLLAGELGEQDRIGIVTYAGIGRIASEPVPGSDQETIRRVIDALRANGGTAGGDGLRQAYAMARRHFNPEAINRIILCTDGDFNLGVTDRAQLAEIVKKGAQEGIYLSAFGFGYGNLHDGRLRELARHGNGSYGYISDSAEVRRAFVEQSRALMVPVAREVKAQVEFNPAVVAAWRVFGHDDRRLNREDFLDDTKDGGELGSGQGAVAVWEVILADTDEGRDLRDELAMDSRYEGRPGRIRWSSRPAELLTASVRYQPVGGGEGRTLSKVLEKAAIDNDPDADLVFTAAVVGLALRLREESGLEDFSWADLRRLAMEGIGPDADRERVSLLEAINRAEEVAR